MRGFGIKVNSFLNTSVLQRSDGYLVPDSQEITNAECGCTSTEVMRTKPAMFDSKGLTVDQYFADSLDGTKVPYFVIRREELQFDGTNPTLLDAYGGFEISMLPGYSAGVGAGWLEKGGVKVIANIRGGGEYGPTWHQAALKEKRHKVHPLHAIVPTAVASDPSCALHLLPSTPPPLPRPTRTWKL
jgi:prolyl oligopeptidase